MEYVGFINFVGTLSSTFYHGGYRTNKYIHLLWLKELYIAKTVTQGINKYIVKI